MATDLGGIREVLMLKPQTWQVAHQVNYAEVQRATLEQRMKFAARRDYFYEKDNHVIKSFLENDLRRYLMDPVDIARIRFITVDYFIPAFLEKLSNVYDTAPVFKFEKELSEDVETKFSNLMKEVKMVPFMSETFKKMRLHNTVMAHVQYAEDIDKIHLNNGFNVGTTYVVEHPAYTLEWTALAYEYITKKNKVVWVVWDRSFHEHYYVMVDKQLPNFHPDKDTKRFDGDVKAIGDDGNLDAPNYGDEFVMPWVIYRYENHNDDFWGNGMDFLVELERVINVLFTCAGDDTIQETIRMLILNFDPAGTQGEGGTMKTGLRHPIYPKGGSIGGQNDAKADVVKVDLYNKDIYELVENISSMVSNLHNIDSPLKDRIMDTLSGIALRLRAEPLLRTWGHDINLVRDYDLELIEKTILVNNYHRKDNVIDPKIMEGLTIDYQEPKLVKDEKEEYGTERMKWEDGISSPVKYLMKQDPEIKSEEDAKVAIKKNLKDSKDVGLQTREAVEVKPAPGQLSLRRLGGEPNPQPTG